MTFPENDFPDSLTVLENQRLQAQYGTEDHTARVRPGIVYCGFAALVAFGCAYATWTHPQVPVGRKPYLAGGLILIGVVFSLVAFFGPRKLRLLAGEIGGEADPIEAVINHENTLIKQSTLWWQVAVVLVTLPLALFGINFSFDGNLLLGIPMIVVAAVIAIINFSRTIFGPSNEFAKQLWPVMDARDYEEPDLEHYLRFLKQSFLKSDANFTVTDYWQKHEGRKNVGWGRYTIAGSNLSSGIFCFASFVPGIRASKMAEILGGFSTVHFDKESESLFGTFERQDHSSAAHMAGLPWQYLNRMLICRIDHDLLQSIALRGEEINANFMVEAVESWEMLTDQIVFEAEEARKNADSHLA